MGKKKATKSRKLRPVIEQYIQDGTIFCYEQEFAFLNLYEDNSVERAYAISFGKDEIWHKNIPKGIHVLVLVMSDGSIDYQFRDQRKYALDLKHDEWFKEQLEQITVMYKLGAYESDIPKRRVW